MGTANRQEDDSGVHFITIPWPSKNKWRRWSLKLAGYALLIYVIYAVRAIWVPLGIAFIIATVLDPVVDRLERRGWSRQAGAVFIFGGFLTVLSLSLVLAIPELVRQGSVIQEELAKHFKDASPAELRRGFREMGIPNWLGVALSTGVNNMLSGVQRSSDYLSAGVQLATNLVWVVIVPIVAFYALRDFHVILGKALLLVPSQKRELVQTALTEGSAIFGKFLRGLALVSAMNGAATWLLLWALRVPSALILGIIAGLLYSVPYLGAILTILLIALMTFLSGSGMDHLLLVVGLNLVLHQVIFDQIISPRVLGGHVGLHPILSIFALLVGNLLLGIAGMILAVPVAACVQIAVLAVVPKLRIEIELPAVDNEPQGEASRMAEESKERHMETDASEDLHRSVNEAVENIEAAVEEELQREAAADKG